MDRVQCAACRHDNRAGAKFCDECGAALPRACPACGASARQGAKFCDECGQPLSGQSAPAPRPAPTAAPERAVAPASYTPRHLAEKILVSRAAIEGERKQVTVLFADCVGFTALSSRLDPEDLHGIMDGCFHHLMEAVHRYEGTVNQFTGDGVMALFGAPIAHEDHAVRAAAAALAIQKAVREYGEGLRAERGLDFALRIGLNTGPVVVGRIGDDLRMDYTAQGETVNLAARLQSAAPPGGVLVSEATRRLVSDYFLTEDRGELTLKGLDRPVRAWEVTAQRGRRARFEVALERGLTPLVGRSGELGFLRESVERAKRGRGHVVSIVGPAGVGKSRLAWELKRELMSAGVTYLEAHCLPHGASAPLHPVIQMLQGNFRLEEGEDVSTQAAKVEHGVRGLDPELGWTIPYLKHLLALPAPEVEAEGLDQLQRKRRMMEAVRALVFRGAQHRPLVLVAEDLQWMDASSDEFFRLTVDGVSSHAVLLVTTYRTGYAPSWQDRSFHRRLSLDPLSEEETLQMAAKLLEVDDLAPTLRQFVLRRAEGNPFFVEELARHLREHDLVAAGADGATLRRELAEGEVPATVHDLLTARIDRLAEPLKRTLQLAAVLGRDFSLSLAQAIGDRGEDPKPHLDELVRLELLHEKDLFPELTYRFGHLLIQQVAYQGLLRSTRAELHARAGAALERLSAGPPDEVLQQIAEHYARSGERERAVSFLVRAGDRWLSLFAYADARADFVRALEALGTDETRGSRAMVLERLGDVAWAEGDLREAQDRWNAALPARHPGGEPARVAELHRKLGVAAWAAGDKDRALAHLQHGLDALGGATGTLEAARLSQEFGRIHFRLGDHDQATDWAKRALTLGSQLGADDVISHAYNTWGVALARAGDIEGGAELVARSLDHALAHQLGAVACRAYTNLAVMYATLDHARSVEYCREGLALAQRIGDQLQQSWLYCTLAGGHCTLAGDYDGGVHAAEAAVELDRRLGQRNHLPIPLIILGQIHQCRGAYDESAACYRQALDVAEEVGEPQLLFPCYDGLATLAVEQGHDDEAERWLARSREVQAATGWSSDTFFVLPFLC
jgi:class 3 adenylate cyclase/tetratricopeptide (TPR) repeat protein